MRKKPLNNNPCCLSLCTIRINTTTRLFYYSFFFFLCNSSANLHFLYIKCNWLGAMPEATTSIDYVMEKASGPHFSGLRIDGPTSSPPASSATAPSVADVNAPKQPFVIGNWLTFALSLFLFPPNFNFWWVNFSFFVLDEPFLLGFNLARVLFLFKGNQFLCVLLVRAIWKCFLLILEAILLILKTLLVHNLVHVWWSSFENCLCCLLIWNYKQKKKNVQEFLEVQLQVRPLFVTWSSNNCMITV